MVKGGRKVEAQVAAEEKDHQKNVVENPSYKKNKKKKREWKIRRRREEAIKDASFSPIALFFLFVSFFFPLFAVTKNNRKSCMPTFSLSCLAEAESWTS